MDIILIQDFESLGLEGDVISVTNGYARNYLIPKGIAIEASNANLKALELRKGKIEARHMKDREDAERAKEKFSELTITFQGKTGKEDKLFGSVTSRDIAEKLEQQGITVDRRKIVIEEPIKTLGEFEVPIKLHPEVIATVKVVVEKETEKGKEKETAKGVETETEKEAAEEKKEAEEEQEKEIEQEAKKEQEQKKSE
jgi:large subunit ribosomal protein L9